MIGKAVQEWGQPSVISGKGSVDDNLFLFSVVIIQEGGSR